MFFLSFDGLFFQSVNCFNSWHIYYFGNICKKDFSSLAQACTTLRLLTILLGVKSVTNSVVSLPYYNNLLFTALMLSTLLLKVNDGDVVTGKTITNSNSVDNVNLPMPLVTQ